MKYVRNHTWPGRCSPDITIQFTMEIDGIFFPGLIGKKEKKVTHFFLHPFPKDQIVLAVSSSLLLLSEVLHLSLPLSPSLLCNFQPVHQDFIYVTSTILHFSIFQNQDFSLVDHPVILYLVPLSFPHLLYSCMQVIHLHNLSLALQLPVLHHSNSLSWGSKPGPVRASTAVHFKKTKIPFSLPVHNPK